MKPVPPSYDLELAKDLELLFCVATKPAVGRAWVRHGAPASLTETCEAAALLSAFEVGIFLVHHDDSRSVYWTTRAPDVFNTTILEQDRSARSRT